ncbi:C40 family peptidase [Aureisphaera galaxeae]|uniref:C40 family peptidase n=1 Tax=Aureisphaera galaxeae TaxID=1538023 RepID=UPI0023505D3C|nr:C40 family peptidase [Aureisphaera galaxeae]MDC8003029.1 C40 family peptidase [Aureisphaera galaxeae]
MKKLLLLCVFSLLLASCGSSRRTTDTKVIGKGTATVTNKRISKVVKHARTFEGTRYKFGGTDKRGMDCSGLVYTSYRTENIELPRVSRDMATKGIRVKLKEVQKGDLVFFKTNKNRNVINHVGLVVESKKGDVHFIHSTSSRGVIISSLDEKYWKNAFVEVRRII